MERFIITGTDTDAGKTTVAAALVATKRAYYWKPIQSGMDENGQTDRSRVMILSQLPSEHFLSESYVFQNPLSPHRAAELEGIEIDPNKILDDYQNHLSHLPSPISLLIEGAGGLMVPITRRLLQIDLFAQMQTIAPTPIILVARTTLGTINHTLLSVAAIRARNLPLHGIYFWGPDNPDNIRTIAEFSGTPVLGHMSID
jgi:dethiobiotin synthetase